MKQSLHGTNRFPARLINRPEEEEISKNCQISNPAMSKYPTDQAIDSKLESKISNIHATKLCNHHQDYPNTQSKINHPSCPANLLNSLPSPILTLQRQMTKYPISILTILSLIFLIMSSSTLQIASAASSPMPTRTDGRLVTALGEKVIIACGDPQNDIKSKSKNESLILWFKDGKIAAMISHNISLLKKYEVVMNRDLLIASAKRNDTGTYECKVGSSPPAKRIIYLDVQYPPEIDERSRVEKLFVEQGSPLKLTCDITASPTPEYTWKFQDQDYKTEGGVGRVLHINHLDYKDSGIYECIARNRLGTASKQWKVIVQSIPKLEVKPYINGAPGKMMTLTCKFRAKPDVNVTWYKDGQPIDMKTDTLIQNRNDETEPNMLQSSLIIERMKESDFNSVYKCTGVNEIGTASVNLSVKGVPEIVEIHNIKEEFDEDGSNSALLEFSTVSHTPLFEFKLVLAEANNGKFVKEFLIPADSKLQDTYHQYFKLTGLRPNSEYFVTMVARNEYGWSETSLNATTFLTNSIHFDEMGMNAQQTRKILASSASIALPKSNVWQIWTTTLFMLCIAKTLLISSFSN